MIYTNIHNLPEAVVNAIGQPRRPVSGRYSVTDISNPPLIRHLKEEYWEDLTQDVSDMIWMLFGSSMHYILEKGSPRESFAEEKLEVRCGYDTIVGVTDLWHDGVISDYKTTSVYSFILGAKKEWTIQLNLYRWLYEKSLGMETNKLEIHAILRDWQQSKAKYDISYPRIPFVVQDIPIVDQAPVIDKWLTDIHNPLPCTPDERWERKTTWAVTKQGNKAASRVLDTEYDAVEWAKNNIDLKKINVNIEERKGESARCKSYCLVSDVCEYNPYKGE